MVVRALVRQRDGGAGPPALLRNGVATTVATVVISLLTWPIVRLTTEHGIDGSWWAGMHMAAHQRMAFGTDVVFTYGPLGFLTVPRLFYPWTTALAVLYSVAVHASLVALVFSLTRRRLGYIWASVVGTAVATVALVEPAELVLVVYFMACIACLSLKVSQRAMTSIVFTGTILSALQLLVKFNTGVVIFALAAALACALPERRLRVVFTHVAASAGLLMVFWIALGQPFDALFHWLRLSTELASGYSAAMAFEQGFRWPEYPIAFATIACLALLLAKRSHQTPRAGRVLSVLIFIIVFYEWKHGFVRHDLHSTGFFLTLAVVALSLLWLGRPAKTSLALALALITMVAVVMPHQTKSFLFRPTKALSQISTLTDSTRRDRLLSESRKDLEEYYRVDGETLRLLAGQRMHADPQIAAIAWIYDLEWHPVPIFQAYSAYTPELDLANAEALAAVSGPSRILRFQPSALDTRNPMFESPAYVLSMLCNFEELRKTHDYEVLGRSTNHCGITRMLTAPEKVSGFVAVPSVPAGSALLMSISHRNSLFERVRTFVFKPAANPFVVIRTDDSTSTYRLIEATASGSLLLCVPRTAGFNGRFVQTHCPRSVKLIHMDGATISFFAIPMSRS